MIHYIINYRYDVILGIGLINGMVLVLLGIQMMSVNSSQSEMVIRSSRSDIFRASHSPFLCASVIISYVNVVSN